VEKSVEYFLALQSPWTYLGHERLLQIAKRHGASIILKPVSLATLFPATGGQPLAKRAPQRQAYRLLELRRWQEHLGIPLNIHPAFFPVDERQAQGMVVTLDRSNHSAALRLAGAMLAAVWAQDRNLAHVDDLIAIAGENGVDGEALLAEGNSDETTAIIDGNTRDAIAANVFGVPNYVVAGVPHWGQDRLEFVDRALAP